MSDYPTLRRSLHALADGAPRDADVETVVARAHRLRRNRTARALLALPAGAAVVAVAVLATTLGGGATAGLGTTPLGTPPADSPAPSVLPSAPALPLPTAVPLPGDETPSPTRSPRPRPSATEPTAEDSAEPGDAAPVRISVKAEPAETETARLVRFTVRVQRPAKGWAELTFDFGDGRGYDPQAGGRICEPGPRGTGGPSPAPEQETDYLATHDHAYRAAGEYDAYVRVLHRTSCTDPGTVATKHVRITVAQGATTSNGPAEPIARPGYPRVSDGGNPLAEKVVRLMSVAGRDDDGWVSSIAVDWGDGSEPTTVDYDTEGCTDSPTTYPSSHRTTSVEHHYESSGSYTATVTVTTVGCDGRDAQQDSATITIKAP